MYIYHVPTGHFIPEDGIDTTMLGQGGKGIRHTPVTAVRYVFEVLLGLTILFRWRPPLNKKMTGIVIATANVEGTITHWDFKTGRSLSTIKDEEAHFLSMDFSHDGK